MMIIIIVIIENVHDKFLNKLKLLLFSTNSLVCCQVVIRQTMLLDSSMSQ